MISFGKTGVFVPRPVASYAHNALPANFIYGRGLNFAILKKK